MGEQSRVGVKWSIARVVGLHAWVGPREIDFGRLHIGAESEERIIQVYNLGTEPFDVKINGVPKGMVVEPAEMFEVGGGEVRIFRLRLRTEEMDVSPTELHWNHAIDVVLTPTAGGRLGGETRHSVELRAQWRRLPRLIITEDGQEVGDVLDLGEVGARHQPIERHLVLSREDGAALEIAPEDISVSLKAVAVQEEGIEDYSACVETQLAPRDGGKRALLTVRVHTHNLPPGRMEGAIRFWAGNDEPPVQPRNVGIVLSVARGRVELIWPDYLARKLLEDEAIRLPRYRVSVPATLYNPSAKEVRVRLAGSVGIDFRPQEVTVPGREQVQVRVGFAPPATKDRGSAGSSLPGANSPVPIWYEIAELGQENRPVDVWRGMLSVIFVEPVEIEIFPYPVEITWWGRAKFTARISNLTDVPLEGRVVCDGEAPISRNSEVSEVKLAPGETAERHIRARGLSPGGGVVRWLHYGAQHEEEV